MIGLWPGEGTEVETLLQAEDRLSYELSCRLPADCWTDSPRHALPNDLEVIPPGPHLAAVVSSVDRTRLNGHDAVRLMQAEARLSSHHEAGKLAAMAGGSFLIWSQPPDAAPAALRALATSVS